MMGCLGSKSTIHADFAIEFNKFASLFGRLKLSEHEVRRLYMWFRSVDVDNSGAITYREFREKLQ